MQYTVKSGDTMYKIAMRYGISLDALVQANPQIEDPSYIIPGMVINIPGVNDGKPGEDHKGDGCMCMPDMELMKEVCLNIPYPEVKVEKPNRRYADMLYDTLANRDSELTAIHMYLYYYTMLGDTQYEEVAELLEAISMIEMKHMHDTMEFIKLLGCEPKYINSCGEPWCATYVNYELYNVCNLLMKIIQDEENAAKLYRETAAEIDEQNLSDWLVRAAMDEEHHAKLFKKCYHKFCKPMG